MIRSERAVSEVVGTIMILTVMIIVISSIMLVGVPMIESSKKNARMDVAMVSFMTLQNDIEEVVRGPIWVKNPHDVANTRGLGPSRETEFELMGGALTVRPDGTNLTCKPLNCSTENVPDFTININPGNITYYADGEEIIYENGAVMRKYEGGDAILESDPLITIYPTDDVNISVSIHAIILNGTLSSSGGSGKTRAEIRMINYSQKVEPLNSPNLNRTNITIFSKYPGVWQNYFEEKFRKAGLVNQTGYRISGTKPVLIQIFGNNTNNAISDIYLSLYESRIDVEVK